MPSGGKRVGAGRRLGSPNTWKHFNDYWTEEEKEDYHSTLKAKYKASPNLMQFVGDHLFGRAPQALSIDGNLNQHITIRFELRNSPALPSLEAGADTLGPS